jgi:hypothetical protein
VTEPAKPAEPKTDLVLDIVLWLQIAVLAMILLQWHPPITPFPPIFPQSAPRPR